MDRRRFTNALLVALVAKPLAAGAQPSTRVWRIGYLASGMRPSDDAPPLALRDALQGMGYVDGQNTTYIGRWGEFRTDRLPGLAAELVGMKVDLVVTFGAKATLALKTATSSIPIVFIGAGDPVAVGLVATLSRPGGNVTGVSDQSNELSAKRLELLKEVMPKAERVAVLWNADDQAMTLRYREIERAASILHMTIVPLGVREPGDFESAFSAMTRERPDALALVTDILTNLNRKRVLEFATARGIPAIYEYGYLVREGGLMSYGPNQDDLLRRAGTYVDRILKGANPSGLPVEQPTRYYLLFNLTTAKSLGVKIPQSVLLRADEVIQ